MVEEGPYEIMPYKEIMELKRDLEELKNKAKVISSEDLINGMHKLSDNMADLIQLFRAASIEVKEESKKENEISAAVRDMLDKLSQAMDENKVIAEGLLAISENMDKRFNEVHRRLDGIRSEAKSLKNTTEYKPTVPQMPQQQRQPNFNEYIPPMPPPNFQQPRMHQMRPIGPPPPGPLPPMNENMEFPQTEPQNKGVFGRMFKR